MNEFVDAMRSKAHARLQAPLPRGRRAPRRRHPVPRAHRAAPGGVLLHVQRPARRGQPDRHLVRPAAEVDRHHRGPAAQPLRVGPHHRHPAARVRDPPRHPPQEGRVRAPRRHPRRRCSAFIADEHRRQRPRARGLADPGRRLLEPAPRAAHRGGRPARSSPTCCPRAGPRVITPAAHPRRDRQDVRLDRRRPLRQEPAPAARHRPPDRHVRVPRAHRLQLPEDRRGVRRPRPHHGHARRARRSGSRWPSAAWCSTRSTS